MDLHDLFAEFEAVRKSRVDRPFLEYQPEKSKEAKELRTRAENGGWNFNDEFLHLLNPEIRALWDEWLALRAEFESLEGKLVHTAHRPLLVDQAHKLAEKFHDVCAVLLKEGRVTGVDIGLYDVAVDEMNAKISFLRMMPDMILRIMDGKARVRENDDGGFDVY